MRGCNDIVVEWSDWMPAIRAIEKGRAIAAIGDVHGQSRLLKFMQSALHEEFRASGDDAATVYLGDYVNKGKESLDVIDAIMCGVLAQYEQVCLTGNHETLLCRALAGNRNQAWDKWIAQGGDVFLRELGLTADENSRVEFVARLGERRIEFLSNLGICHRIGNVLFVHAGIDPREPLSALRRSTAISMREPFLSWNAPFPEDVAVIHGHTPRVIPEHVPGRRINLDTSAARPATLSCLFMRGDRMRFLQTRFNS